MGILNITPDSFSDGGRHVDLQQALDAAHSMKADGADILDIGGESTRPGAAPVDPTEELQRVGPVLEALQDIGLPLSLDSRRPSVVDAALDIGIDLINDVGGFQDPEMRSLLSDPRARGVGVCVMHMQGEPQQMQVDPHYQDVVAEVHGFLQKQLGLLEALGIARERILLDPGFGFGKTLAHNRALFEALPSLCSEQHVLVGVSRKRMIGQLSSREDSPAHERLGGSLAAAVLAAQAGASVIRVHDVRETVDALRVWNRLTHQTSESMTGTSTSTPTTVARAAPE
jgi:dihydropteroate synthase